MFEEKEKGFTLIELLVVIAIIGILAGILFVAINPKKQTDEAKDAKIKAQLSQVRTQAALVFSKKKDFSEVCDDAQVKKLSTSCVNSYDGGSWAASSDLTTEGQSWCVDSNGTVGSGVAMGGEDDSSACGAGAGAMTDSEKCEAIGGFANGPTECWEITETQCHDTFPTWTWYDEEEEPYCAA